MSISYNHKTKIKKELFMSKLNLLELCLSPAIGGLELYMVHAAKALNDDFNVLSVIAEGSQLEQYFNDSQYKSQSIKHKGDSSFFSALKIAKIIDNNYIDIVHIHWTSDLPTLVMARMISKRTPKLVQSRHMNMTRFKNDPYHRFLYKKMDLILTVTSQLEEQVKKFIPEDIRPKVETLYIGSEPVKLVEDSAIKVYKKTLGIGDELLVGMVGRIEEAKGQHLLIEAVESLKAQGKSIKVFFVGHVMNEEYLLLLKKMLKEKDLEKEVVFYGFTKEPLKFMQTCDMMVLATGCETFGLVLIEAMQVGTPVVATNQCGPLEIIENGKSGLLFEVGNAQSLSEKLGLLIEDKTLRESLALEAKKRASEKFSSQKQFQKLGTILKMAMN